MSYVLEPAILQVAAFSCLGVTCVSLGLGVVALLIMLMRRQGVMRSLLFSSNTVFLPLLLPGFFAALTITAIFATNKFMSESGVTTGRVVRLAENSSEGSITYSAVVEFTPLAGGAPITFDDSSRSCAPPCHQVGQEVSVRYRLSNPQQAIINAPMLIWVWAGVFALLTIVFFVIALIMGWRSFESMRKGGMETTAGQIIVDSL